MSKDKNKRISQTIANTRQRHANLSCRTIQTKVDSSCLSQIQHEFLNRLFLEAKWFSNSVIGSGDIFNYDYKTKEVEIYVNGSPERRDLSVIGSQMKQSLLSRIKQDVINLSKLKTNGAKTGKLRFKRFVNSIPLKQVGVTFALKDDNRVRIQGCKKPFKVNGINQISDNSEITSAMLIKKGRKYYIHFIVFEEKKNRQKTGEAIGLDFGVSTTVTTSDGDKFDIKIPESHRLKLLQKRLSRKKKYSNNWYRTQQKIQEEYHKLNNRKKDKKNKVVHYLTTNYDIIACQDENISGWSRQFGKQVGQSLMSGVISDLRKKSETFIEVDQYYPSTQLCSVSNCFGRQKLNLSERTYHCQDCGNTIDRDINSAVNILSKGLMNQCMWSVYTINSCGADSLYMVSCKETAEKQEAFRL